MAMCAETGIAEKVKSALSNRWMSLESILSTLVEVVESMNGEVTVEWPAVTMAHTNSLCCSLGNLINTKNIRFWGCQSEDKCKSAHGHRV